MMEVVSGDNWSDKVSKAPVKSSPPTVNFLQAGCPFCHPTNSVKALKGESITFCGLAYPKLTWRSSILVFTPKGSCLLWGGFSSLSSAQYPGNTCTELV